MHIEGEDRYQSVMFPDTLEEYIEPDNQVRFIDAFVEGINLEILGFDKATPKATGRPPYNPADLLKLYLYGYLNRTRSGRQLERETYRNVEVLWLLRKLHPDFKTITDFRSRNAQAIRNVCRSFTMFCREEELFGGEMIAIDGSKFRASNSKKRNFTRSKVQRLIKETEEKIDDYLKQLDEEDQKESNVKNPTAEELRKKIDWMKQNIDKYLNLEKEMTRAGLKQVSLTDPDSRAMFLGQAVQISYNPQLAVDAKNKMIVDHELTNSVNDLGQLAPLALRVKEFLGVSGFELLADRGYYFGQQIKTCIDAGITPYIPKPNNSSNRKKKMFTKEDFTYLSDQDVYRCPAKNFLTYKLSTTERGRNIRYYRASDCKGCELKPRCTQSPSRRTPAWRTRMCLTRWLHESVLIHKK